MMPAASAAAPCLTALIFLDAINRVVAMDGCRRFDSLFRRSFAYELRRLDAMRLSPG
jgi:hypothetical protein